MCPCEKLLTAKSTAYPPSVHTQSGKHGYANMLSISQSITKNTVTLPARLMHLSSLSGGTAKWKAQLLRGSVVVKMCSNLQLLVLLSIIGNVVLLVPICYYMISIFPTKCVRIACKLALFFFFFLGCVELITVTTPKKYVNVTVGESILLQCMYESTEASTSGLTIQWDFVSSSSTNQVQVDIHFGSEPEQAFCAHLCLNSSDLVIYHQL